jgi:hypothetical protein
MANVKRERVKSREFQANYPLTPFPYKKGIKRGGAPSKNNFPLPFVRGEGQRVRGRRRKGVADGPLV